MISNFAYESKLVIGLLICSLALFSANVFAAECPPQIELHDGRTVTFNVAILRTDPINGNSMTCRYTDNFFALLASKTVSGPPPKITITGYWQGWGVMGKPNEQICTSYKGEERCSFNDDIFPVPSKGEFTQLTLAIRAAHKDRDADPSCSTNPACDTERELRNAIVAIKNYCELYPTAEVCPAKGAHTQ